MEKPYPVLDNHIHLDPLGRRVEAIKEFSRSGGTHIVLVHKPYRQVPVTEQSGFLPSFETTLKLAEEVKEKTDVQVLVAVGAYPVEFVRLLETLPFDDAKTLMLRGMEEAAELVNQGLVHAIGEIGRPHFPVSEEIMSTSNEILSYGMSLAKDVHCPVVIHCETGTPEVFEDLAKMADKVGLERDKVIKHYSPPIVDVEENFGLIPSVLASSKSTMEAAANSRRFMLETDYLDDPKRPGAVMGPKTVPKRCKELLEKGVFSEDDLFKINKELPEKVYGVALEF